MLINRLSLQGIPRPISSALPVAELSEPLDFLRDAQQAWNAKIIESITTLCSNLNELPISEVSTAISTHTLLILLVMIATT